MNDTDENIKYTINVDLVADDNSRQNQNNQSNKISEMMKEFENTTFEFDVDDESGNGNISQDELYAIMANYDVNYTAKQLTSICEYYNIGKMVKWKKADIISAIVAFENNLENYYIVERRRTVWKYMEELKQDSFMKKFIVGW